MNKPPWLKVYPHYVTLQIKVKPGSKENQISIESSGQQLLLSLQAAACEGKANKMLIKYLAKRLRVQQKDILIQIGKESRNKVIRILTEDRNQEQIVEWLMTNIAIK
ncbi:DUF167 domain-containing protein [Legionella oakridgensis]|uniref:UPF0235 protein Loa_00569 n=2 Tax=Legionella oakridgensis TaxID=29423 RepID=W0BCJ3_9GAMM|nr:DUF167 domain-containing protein [Legionella oakridgensis]AHE66139.1 hypothetical protein Loa_00569 [Legionella oakridgensis ATCC 33761 = DSM 21215]ETO94005.1 hypothetical protein LOR_52c10050 [Legionella oakridgensis RV-2-2007]KTD43883.1 hypothetical protein Loak_0433 [Legionella oakridgensis]STY16051.1 Uncharacterised ACR, YggU family COG1872 [Legionella longbeachae]